MRTTDWNFDFSTLPYWNMRDTIPYVHDEFFEITNSDMLCCIYSISEVTMLNFVGRLAILKDKSSPKLWFSVPEEIGFCSNFFADEEGNLIFLQPSIYYRDVCETKRPILIIDVPKNAFSYVETDNFNPSYVITRLENNVYGVCADEDQKKNDKCLARLCKKKINTDRLKWHDISQLDQLPMMLLRNL